MSSRSKRKILGKESLKIMEDGYYVNSKGQKISVEAAMRYTKQHSIAYTPDDFISVLKESEERLNTLKESTLFEVHNETTFASVRRLQAEGYRDVVCLNFASAKNPGGGFLNGSQAQEEALARASGMYACLIQFKEHYEYHRKNLNCLYSDRMIYSPRVPVFRDDKDVLLDEPYQTSIITSPAVNAGCVQHHYKQHLSVIPQTMIDRIEKVLALAVIHKHEAIALGAWGCGVFQNAPVDMVQWFAHHLTNGKFKNAFKKVVFGVLDHSKEHRFIQPFEDFDWSLSS